jgi:hypothetical protein
LPLIIFWNAATGQPQAGAVFVLAIATLSAEEIDQVRIERDAEKSILSFLSILAQVHLGVPDCPMQPQGNFKGLKLQRPQRRHR